MKNKISRTVILPVLLYRCETWSLTLRKEPRLRRGEVTGNWGILQNEEFCDEYSSPNILWVIKSRRM
jgi:hypothetical protein